ncbi:MAG TPA: transposase [Gammaproteobacteria bacterium]|nr:transposase [Gammaproteobacteria bacterium]
MKRLQAFKYELRLNGAQRRCLYRIAGSCRYVFNKALGLQRERYEKGEKKLNYAGLCKLLTTWKYDKESLWLQETPSQALQQSLKDLERAYTNFFAKRADFPCFKRRGAKDSFRLPQGCRLEQENDRIFIPKLGWLRYRNSRKALGELSNVTISRHGDKWYVSIQTERTVKEAIHPSKTAIGIDVGVAKLATLSDGRVFEAINSFAQYQARLAFLQRAASKKKKRSSNWKKAITRVNRVHCKISCVRQDYLHKTTSAISKNHALVCLEDLKIKNMSKSAAGSLEAPGKKVRAKSGLNKAILDQGWYEFRRQLEYKEAWLGGFVLAVPPQNTSRTCPECGHVSSENRLSQAHFACVACGYQGNADQVAAINILRAGHARLACGELVQLGHSMKQEPAEMAQACVA